MGGLTVHSSLGGRAEERSRGVVSVKTPRFRRRLSGPKPEGFRDDGDGSLFVFVVCLGMFRVTTPRCPGILPVLRFKEYEVMVCPEIVVDRVDTPS